MFSYRYYCLFKWTIILIPTHSQLTTTGITTTAPVCGYDNAINSTYTCVCDQKQECMNDIVCPVDTNCRVECSNYQSCKGSSITCPSDHNCTVRCSEYASCYSANIQWPSSGTPTLICDGIYRSCKGVNFPIPPPYEDFTLDCDHAAACEDANMYCPEYADCHIICSERESCINAIIHWSLNDVESTLSCTFGQDECTGVNLPPTRAPTLQPTSPTGTPTTATPTEIPSPTTAIPTQNPSAVTATPTVNPTAIPTASSAIPTISPTTPTRSPTTEIPTGNPSESPTTAIPTENVLIPTEKPTEVPSSTIPTATWGFTTEGDITIADPHQHQSDNTLFIVATIGAITLSMCIIGCAVRMIVRTKTDLDKASEPGNMFGVPPQNNKVRMPGAMLRIPHRFVKERVLSISAVSVDQDVNVEINDIEGSIADDRKDANNEGEEDIEIPGAKLENDVNDERDIGDNVVTSTYNAANNTNKTNRKNKHDVNADGKHNDDIITEGEKTTGK